MTDTNIYQFDDVAYGSADWQSMVAFVQANDIPIKTTPARARFWIGENMIFIEQFYTNESGARMVSMLDSGFVKNERWFPLKRGLEEFRVKFTQVDRTSVEFPSESPAPRQPGVGVPKPPRRDNPGDAASVPARV